MGKTQQRGKDKNGSIVPAFRSWGKMLELRHIETRNTLLQDCVSAFETQQQTGKSYWLQKDQTPKCGLEMLAKHILTCHTATIPSNLAVEGIEWWAQVRGPAHPQGHSIGFHWDRDEVLADKEPGNIKHPIVATVTYLTDIGAPTVVFDVTPLPYPSKREGVLTTETDSGFLSHPAPGKHIAFDGRLLHGVPEELMIRSKKNTEKPKRRKTVTSPNLEKNRITFLANVWSKKPLDIETFPDNIISKCECSVEKVNLLLRAAKKTKRSNKAAPINPPLLTELSMDVLTKVESRGDRICGFSFGREGDEEHELWMPISKALISMAEGISVRVKFTTEKAIVSRKPPSKESIAKARKRALDKMQDSPEYDKGETIIDIINREDVERRKDEPNAPDNHEQKLSTKPANSKMQPNALHGERENKRRKLFATTSNWNVQQNIK
eukprot:m.25525 g.25525  ORF g.25525 m.25525 type:complete len:437 (-) comp7712_c0_seq1:11-1321(-)